MKTQSRSFSYNLKERSQLQKKQQKQTSTEKKSMSLQKTFQQSKLPLIKIKNVMKKIGASDKFSSSFTPTQQQIGAFRKSKWLQLKQQYSSRGGKKQPFEYELDQIVLDCWQYGQKFGRKTIWRKYKQNFDELTFDTLRVVHRKK